MSSVICVFLPLINNRLLLTWETHYNPARLIDMSICAQIINELSKRHEIADFFQSLLEATLSVSHQQMANAPSDASHRSDKLSPALSLKLGILSRVINYQGKVFSLGKI